MNAGELVFSKKSDDQKVRAVLNGLDEDTPSIAEIMSHIVPVPVSANRDQEFVIADAAPIEPEPTYEHPFNDVNLAVFCAVIELDKTGLAEWFMSWFLALGPNSQAHTGLLTIIIDSFRAFPPTEMKLLKTLVKEAAEQGQRILASARKSNTYATALSAAFELKSSLAQELASEESRKALANALKEHDARMTAVARTMKPAELKAAIIFFCELGLDVGIGSFVAVACENIHTMNQTELRAFIDMPHDVYKKNEEGKTVDPLEQIIKEATKWAEPLKPKIAGTEIITITADGQREEKLVMDGELLDTSEFE
jgi:hypothetical protein